MFKHLLLTGLAALILCGCGQQTDTPNTDIDVARTFIKTIQENKFKEASAWVLSNETNKQYFELFEKHFESKSTDELNNYKNADIIINEISNVSDSVTVINYSNSYKKDAKNKLKVVKVNGRWLIDLQYTFSGNL